jgi:catechol 2,3-dioxygenase-like lactoylglutathione lyase family enzyme
MSVTHALVAIVPCSDLDTSEAFYNRLGFIRAPGSPEDYRMLTNDRGDEIHLTQAPEGWLVPGCNPFGLYLRTADVDALAARFDGQTVGGRRPENKPWGMYEFALSDPDGTLVRIGRPTQSQSKE